MPLDYILFCEASQNNGYDYITPISTGEDLYAVSGDDLYIQDDGKILAAQFISATTAKGARARFKAKRQADWSEITGCSLDSGLRMPGWYYAGHPLRKGDILNVQVDNTNTASEVSAVGLFYRKGGGGSVSIHPPNLDNIPDAYWVKGIFTTACVAKVWVDMAAGTWSYNWNRDKQYRIIAGAGTSATGLGWRLKPRTGSSPEFLASRPGGPASYELTEVNGPVVYFNNFNMTFSGLNPPLPQWCATTTDSSQKLDLLVVEL